MTSHNAQLAVPPTAEVEILIPFHDVDLMRVVWHGHYYKYFEIARTALFRTIGYDVLEMQASGYAWPVIESQCRYISPIRYGMKIQVTVTLQEYEHRLKLKYLILDPQTGRRLAKGTTIQVAVEMASEKMCLISPKILFEKLKLNN